RPARIRRVPVVRLVDRRLAVRLLAEPGEDLVAREAHVAVQLGGEHLHTGGRRAHADLTTRLRERFEHAGRVPGAGGGGYAEKDAHSSENSIGAETRPGTGAATSRPWRLPGRSRVAADSARRAR